MECQCLSNAYGKRGEISDSLEIDYTGHWEEKVVDFVAGIENDCDGKAPGCGDLDVVHKLLIELPEEIPIVEIEWVSSETPGTVVEGP